MESTTLVANLQDENNGSVQVLTDCLGTAEILKTILENFSNQELLKLSLVNKQWNYEARSLMRRRGTLTARMKRDKSFCQDLKAFASDVKRMNVVPFSGLYIILAEGGGYSRHRDQCTESSTEFDLVYKDILERLPWRRLVVQLFWFWEDYKTCPGFFLLKKILQSFCSTLEEFSLLVQSNQAEFIQDFLQDCKFPRLMSLTLKDRDDNDNTTSEDYTNLIKAIVSRAPNLKILNTGGRVNLRGNLLEGSSAVHVTGYSYCPGFHKIPENVVGQLRMQRISLTSFGYDLSLDQFHRITSGLLQTSSTSLRAMEIRARFLEYLSMYGICIETMRELEIDIYAGAADREYQLRMWRLLKAFDFTRLFPSLNAVTVIWPMCSCSTAGGLYEYARQVDATSVEALPDRTVNIKNLHVYSDPPMNDCSVRFLAEIFPHIQKLSISAEEIPFGRIFESWGALKELHVDTRESRTIQNLDSVFCGIFPEEVAELRRKNEEFLRKVHVVPVMPSIISMKGEFGLSFSINQVITGNNGGFVCSAEAIQIVL